VTDLRRVAPVQQERCVAGRAIMPHRERADRQIHRTPGRVARLPIAVRNGSAESAPMTAPGSRRRSQARSLSAAAAPTTPADDRSPSGSDALTLTVVETVGLAPGRSVTMRSASYELSVQAKRELSDIRYAVRLARP